MDCASARELLSAYFDGELPRQSTDDIDKHLESCDECQREIDQYRKLSQLTAQLKTITGPSQFAQLQQNLTLPAVTVQQTQAVVVRQRSIPIIITMAMTACVLATLMVWLHNHHSYGLEASFDRFLGAFSHSPEQADNLLSEIYSGQPVSLAEAEKLLKYRPAVAGGLPPGYTLASAYVIKMPCCTCLQANLRHLSGRGIVVFEHDGHQPHWFGNRPAIDTVCKGQATRLVQLEGSIAATCRCRQRYLTVIGPKDLGEVDQLIGFWVQDGSPSHPN